MFVISLLGLHCAERGPPVVIEGELSTSTKIYLIAVLSDALISISALVVGILGALSIIQGMPPAASYTLIGIGGGITLIWVAVSAFTKGKNLEFIKELCVGACNPSKSSGSTKHEIGQDNWQRK